MKKERLSNLEALRIVSMLLIISSHYMLHGITHNLSPTDSYRLWYEGGTFNRAFSSAFILIGHSGVSAFFMLSGYFQINRDKVSIKRVVLETFYYAVFALILYAALLVSGVHVPELTANGVIGFFLKALFTPVTGGAWWFVTVYVIISLVAPLLNKFMRQLNQKGMLMFVLLFWVLWFSISSMGATYYAIERGMFFYVLGAYIRRFREEPLGKLQKVKYAVVFLGMWAAGSVLQHYGMINYITNIDSLKGMLFDKAETLICTAVITPVCAFTMFEIFRSTEIKNNALINRFAECTFGVYLIHDSLIGRNYIWYSLLKVDTVQYNSALYPLWFVLSVLGIFIVCALIDMLRIKWVEPVMVRTADGFINKVTDKYMEKQND